MHGRHRLAPKNRKLDAALPLRCASSPGRSCYYRSCLKRSEGIPCLLVPHRLLLLLVQETACAEAGRERQAPAVGATLTLHHAALLMLLNWLLMLLNWLLTPDHAALQDGTSCIAMLLRLTAHYGARL